VSKVRPVLSAVVGVPGAIVRRTVAGFKGGVDNVGRWRVVTIARTAADIAPEGQLPRVLAELGSDIDVEIRPAPKTWGTEVAVRWVGPAKPASGEDPEILVRRNLCDVKQLAEVGEILRVLPRPEGRRPATPTGWLVDKAEQQSEKGALL
jgi:hypothetical protein